MSADEYLQGEWCNLRNSQDIVTVASIRGAIVALREVGVLTSDQAELWERRILTCPGHDDEGGRQWCAYCGEL
jgi:hypothetical protein